MYSIAERSSEKDLKNSYAEMVDIVRLLYNIVFALSCNDVIIPYRICAVK